MVCQVAGMLGWRKQKGSLGREVSSKPNRVGGLTGFLCSTVNCFEVENRQVDGM